jgi:hypothetical protein
MDDLLDDPSAELAELLTAPIDPATVRMRHSILKRMADSPAHVFHACQMPPDDSISAKLGALAIDRKDAYRFGSAVHDMLLLDGAKVGRVDASRATKAGKAQAEDLRAQGKVHLLSAREHALAVGIVDAVKRNELAMRMLFDGTVREQLIEFDLDGRACRATPDARTASRIVDLKTTRSAKPQWFRRDVTKLFYHSQLAFYDRAHHVDEHVIVAVEKSPPFPVTVFRLEPDVIENGRKLVRLWMEQLNVCEATGAWPEYASAIVPIEADEDELQWAMA